METDTRMFRWQVYIPWTTPDGDECHATIELAAPDRDNALKNAVDCWHDEADERWLRAPQVYPHASECVLGMISVTKLSALACDTEEIHR